MMGLIDRNNEDGYWISVIGTLVIRFLTTSKYYLRQ